MASKILRKKGIKVVSKILEKDVKLFYQSYILSKKDALPFVTCKLAVSRDFFTINKKNRWVTNEFSRGRVHLFRSQHDCIMTSSNTIIKDNPRLTCRIKGLKYSTPARIILDNKLKIPIKSNIFSESKKYQTIVFYNKINVKKINIMKKMRIKIFKIPIDNSGNIDLKECLIKAKKLGFSRIFLESGIKLTKNFLQENLVNELKVFVSDKNLGKDGGGSIKKYLRASLKKRKFFSENVNLIGEKLLSYKLK